MSSSLLQFREQVRIKRPEIQGDRYFTDLVLNRYLNEGQWFVQTQLASLGIKEWEASDSLTLSAGTLGGENVKTASLATDCLNRLFDDKRAIKFIDCAVSTGAVTDKGIAHYIDDDKFVELLKNSYLAPTAKEPVFTRLNNLIYIAPSTIDTATAFYYKAITVMALDADVSTIPIAFEEFIVKRALISVDEQLGKLAQKEEKINQLMGDLKNTFTSIGTALASEQPTAQLQ